MAVAEFLALIVSLFILSHSSKVVVDSSLKLARFFNISQLAIGFLLIAVATSLPELAVSVTSSSVGEGAIAAGNVFGSNISNILLILGIGAYFYGIKIRPMHIKDVGLMLLLTTLISVYIIFSSSVQQKALTVIEGMVLMLIFGVYAYETLKKRKVSNKNKNSIITKKEALEAFLYFGVGIIVVIISSAFVVNSAVAIANIFGVARSFIGATLIAIGTSLPELSATLYSLKKRHYGLVLGNIMGSNITNLTLVLGAASVINQIALHLQVFIIALLFAIIANSILFYVAAVNKSIGRSSGIIFLVIYAIYTIIIAGLQISEFG